MDKDMLESEINDLQTQLARTPVTDEAYQKISNALSHLQGMLLKEREFDLKERTETCKTEVETYSTEMREKEFEERRRENKRQSVLAYTKIIVGSIGTVGSILLVTACEEEKIIRSKAYQFVRNFAQKFI